MTPFRLAAALAVIAATTIQPACAQQMTRILERGPVGFLHGQVLRQAVGDLSAGDFAHPAMGDWTGDGRPDLVVGSGYGDLLLFGREGAGAYDEPKALLPADGAGLAAPPRRLQVSPWIGDVAGDGQPELLLGMGDRVYRYRISGGTTADGRLIAGPGTNVILPGPLAPSAADIEGDGAVDVLVVDGDGRVFAIDAIGARAVTAGGAPLQVAAPARAWAGDFDGDARADIILGSGDGHIVICRGSANGFGAPETLLAASAADGLEAAPWATDWTGDGRLDLLVGWRGGLISLYEQRDGALHPAGRLQQRRAPVDVGRAAAATAGDWDGDGLTDIVVGGEDGTVWLLKRLPGEEILFERAQQVVAGDAPVLADGAGDLRYAVPALVDWDGDGQLDLLVGGSSGRVLLWMNRGGLRAMGPIRVGGADLRVIGIAFPAPVDYNADGDMDLFVGGRPMPDRRIEPGVLLPEIPAGCAYFENTADRPGTMPVFSKGVPIATTLVTRESGLRRDAGFLGAYAVWPVRWRGGATRDFVAVTQRGAFLFANTARRGAYASLEAECEDRALPPALLPPLYSVTPSRLNDEIGLLAADAAYGFVTWYPPSALRG